MELNKNVKGEDEAKVAGAVIWKRYLHSEVRVIRKCVKHM